MKKKTNNKFFIFLIIIVIVVIVVYVIKKNKRNKLTTNLISTGQARPGTSFLSAQSNSYSDLQNGSYPVARGQVSKLVYLLQFALNKLHNANLVLDGNFGSKTEAAIEKYYNTNTVNQALAKHIYLQVAKQQNNDLQVSQMVNLMQNYL